jgi:hypothetical protein
MGQFMLVVRGGASAPDPEVPASQNVSRTALRRLVFTAKSLRFSGRRRLTRLRLQVSLESALFRLRYNGY